MNKEVQKPDRKDLYDGLTHVPVLADKVLEYLDIRPGPMRIVDGTVGGGGHSSLILEKNTEAELLGIDRDREALARARKRLQKVSSHVHLVEGKFSAMGECIAGLGWHSVDAVLLDLGVSSFQLDTAERGFSHRLDGPLDMRMDHSSGNTASRILNNAPQEELERIFREYGEMRDPGRLARAILRARQEKPLSSTAELKEICEKSFGQTRRGGPPVATLCFQSLRIAVNGELDEISKGLKAAEKILRPGGRMVVISFHSLEDRIVKNFFRERSASCLCPPGLPICICKHRPTLEILTRKPVTADENELETNRRAAPAKLRAARKI